MTDNPNLYQKILAVMQDVAYLQKDDRVKFGTTDYKAISEEKVTSTVRESLIKHGLVILPAEQEHLRDGQLSTVNTKYKIVDVDTGEFELIVSSGTGADSQDKGVGKAMTYAFKYLLLRTFAIPTGDDPDQISSAELDAKQSGTTPPPPDHRHSSTTTPPPGSQQASDKPQSLICVGCGATLEEPEYKFSMSKFKKPLCRAKCQKSAK